MNRIFQMLVKNLLSALMFLMIINFKVQAQTFYGFDTVVNHSATYNVSGGVKGSSYSRTSTFNYSPVSMFLNNPLINYLGSQYQHRLINYDFLTKLDGELPPSGWDHIIYLHTSHNAPILGLGTPNRETYSPIGYFNKAQYYPANTSLKEEFSTASKLIDASTSGEISYRLRVLDQYGSAPSTAHKVQIHGRLRHIFSSEHQTIYDIAQWLDNLSIDYSPINNAKKLLNGKNNNKKSKIINLKGPTAIGIRASVDLSGTNVHTSSPGWVTYELLLPSTDTFHLPFAFGDNKDEATLDIFLNDQLITTLLGVDYVKDELNTVALDISGLVDTTATIQFLLNTDGERADIFIPESINFSAVSAVPEPSTYAMLVSGLALILFGYRNKRVS